MWVYSGGTPSTVATSSALRQVMVVQTDPMPLARRASMKLHTAGITDPHQPGREPAGSSSGRPSWKATSRTGTSW